MKFTQEQGPVLEGQIRGNEENLKQEMREADPVVTGGVSKHFGDPAAMAEEGRVRAEALRAYGEAKAADATLDQKVVSVEWEPNTPDEFRSLTEIAPFVNELMAKINASSDQPTWFRKINVPRGVAESALQVARDGAKKISKDRLKMEIYKKAAAKSAGLAWEYVKRTANENLLDVVGGKIVERGVYSNDGAVPKGGE